MIENSIEHMYPDQMITSVILYKYVVSLVCHIHTDIGGLLYVLNLSGLARIHP